MIDTDAIKRLELDEDRDAYAAYIRQVTDDGQAIVDCLIRIMEDDSVGAKPHERLEAQQLLDSIAFGHVAVEQAETPTPAADPPRPADPTRHRHPAFVLSEETLFRLPALVKQKTDMGKKMADFLNSAVRGELSDFRPHHWIKAVKHLSARGYSRDRDPRPELPGPRSRTPRPSYRPSPPNTRSERPERPRRGRPQTPTTMPAPQRSTPPAGPLLHRGTTPSSNPTTRPRAPTARTSSDANAPRRTTSSTSRPSNTSANTRTTLHSAPASADPPKSPRPAS